MDWKILAVFTPILFVIYQSLSKFIPKDAPIFLISAVASFVGAITMFILHKLSPGQAGSIDMKLLPIVILIGVLVSVGNFLIVKAYSIGAPQSGFSSIFYPTLIIYAVIFGLIFWHEKLTFIQFLGAIMSITGTVILVYFRK
jgi:drug/metabolite transporter (DMT)-like permease